MITVKSKIDFSKLLKEFENKRLNQTLNTSLSPRLANILKEFIKNRINESLEQIGFREAFSVDKKLLVDTMWFEEELLGNNATDFFHSRPVEYSKNSQTFDADDLF